ncbi:MAG: hypothetical protein NUV46_01215 [Nanoarchaeota archaeon]|nr:hypothetical protein [Nanoarchaeota archaeon]
MSKHDLIALYDMDGTLFDYEGQLKKDLELLRSPEEKEVDFNFNNNPPYIENRIKLIKSSESWWENLPPIYAVHEFFALTKEFGFRNVILTQGPKGNPAAWSGKKKCIEKHFGEEIDITITRDKGLVYGKVLFDDFPDYILKWLKWRKNGVVIMPTNKTNESFKHPQVIRYDGLNGQKVEDILLCMAKGNDLKYHE